MKKLFRYLILMIFLTAKINAQVMPERMKIFNPLFNETMNDTGQAISFMNSIGGWGEFGNYLSERNKTHEWYQKLGLFFEFFRIGNEKSLAVLSNIEFIADPNNDINFNPRAIFWEEAFLYSLRTGNNFLQAGYYHRCKHDIDNLDYGTERSLIYGSIMGRYILSLAVGEELNGYASLRGDFYTILQDYKKPDAENIPDIENLVSSAAINIVLKNSLSSFIGFSMSAYFQLSGYSYNRGFFEKYISMDYFKAAAGIEGAILITGNVGFGVNFRYEYLPDTGLNVIPASAKLISLGISLSPIEVW